MLRMSGSVRSAARRICFAAVLVSTTLPVAAQTTESPAPTEPDTVPAAERPQLPKMAETRPVKVDFTEFPQGWTFYSAQKEVQLSDTWSVIKEGDGENVEEILRCVGIPSGYLKSVKQYKNFELSLEWRFPTDPNGNSGILIHTSSEDRIWPNSIQVQLHGPTTGSIFPLGDAMSANKLQIRDQKLASGQWHRCLITSLDGRVAVSINGTFLGEVTGCSSDEGSISLQSEGSEIHFRKITIKELPTQATTGPTVINDPDNEES
jgi:hypothetical protein